jgi:protein phosphatase
MKGKNNEDRYAVSAYYVDEQKHIPSLLAVVSDGIGGHRAGEVAAEIAVDKISDIVAQSDATQPLATLQEAVAAASLAVRNQAEADVARKGMGATCACTWIIGDRLFIASVGDSRIYLIRDEKIHKLTTDHTWIQEALEQGVLTPEQARGHPNAHVIRRYLGSQQPAEADIRLKFDNNLDQTQPHLNQGLRLEPDDILFMCSDGLTDLVEDGEIEDRLREMRLEEALKTLVNLANERGGHDNITIVALKMPKSKEAPTLLPGKFARGSSHAKRKGPLPVLLIALGGAGLVLVLAALGLAGFYFLGPGARSRNTQTPTPTLTQTLGVSATPSRTLTPAATPTRTPTATLNNDSQLTPPVLRVTVTVIQVSPRPTITSWPTSTGVFLDLPTPSATVVRPAP